MKTCHYCDTEKPKNEFYKNNRKHDGLTTFCKKCLDKINKSNKAQKKRAKKRREETGGLMRENFLIYPGMEALQ